MGNDEETDCRLGGDVRTDLRNLSHQIFDRLVLEQQVEDVNRLENVLTIVIYLTIGIGAALVYNLAATAGAPFLDGLLDLSNFDPSDYYLWVGGAAALLSVIFLGKPISDWGLRQVGRSRIYLARRLPGAAFAAQRREIIAIVEEWLRSNPGKPAEEVLQRFGRGVDAMLPRALRQRLDRLNRKKGALDYLIFRKVLERKYKAAYLASWFRSPRPHEADRAARFNYYVRARDLRNAIKINLIFHYLGADLRDETPDGADWRREYVTAPEKQHLTLWDDANLPTRFRTFGPHLRWPRDEHLSQTSSVGESPTYVAIASVENPLAMPLYLLTVDDVLAALAQVAPTVDSRVGLGKVSAEDSVKEAMHTLQTTPVPMFAKKDKSTLRALGGVDAPELTILRDSGGVFEMRWDPNRILWDRLDPAASSDLLRALAMVLAAVELCIEGDAAAGAPPRAKPVILRRGDLLITDNQRTLICRREADFYGDDRSGKLGFKFPPQWWLRGYYGFRIAQKRGDERALTRS